MYDNPCEDKSFYPMEIDGRLRLRTSKLANTEPNTTSKEHETKLSWKRKLAKYNDEKINKEEEVEIHISQNETENLTYILEDVLQCKKMSSYERYRNLFESKVLSITIDEFPYGLMLEIELKNSTKEEYLSETLKQLGLNIEDSSRTSCDGMYTQLCNINGVKPNDDILFSDKDMPQIL